jgi:rare lipoprotein A
MHYLFCFLLFVLLQTATYGQQDSVQQAPMRIVAERKPYYGIASFYADKFNGRPTANGEIYSHSKFTAACNVLPLGTWIRVTNLRNNRSIIVKTNDRLHPRMKRIVDLSKSAAQKLGYIGRGLTQVKVEVLERVKSGAGKRDK